MHVIGFEHEHQRNDRDNYITVSNVQPRNNNIIFLIPKWILRTLPFSSKEWAFALQKSTSGEFQNFGTGYDFGIWSRNLLFKIIQ